MLLIRNNKKQNAQFKKEFEPHFRKWLTSTNETCASESMTEMRRILKDSGLSIKSLIPSHIKPQNEEQRNKKKNFKTFFEGEKVIPLKKQMEAIPTHVVVPVEQFQEI